jgi:hypothetical protein
MQHLDENAELYALGELDPAERAEIEAHLATCTACVERVAEAASVVAAMASALPARDTRSARRPSSPLWLAAAAVIAIGFGILGWAEVMLRYQTASTAIALQTLVNNHFLHVQMTGTSATAPNAKVMYGRDGSWIYVIVDAPQSRLHVVLTRAGERRDVGELEAAGHVSALLVENAGHPRLVELRDITGVTNAATLIYPPAPTTAKPPGR